MSKKESNPMPPAGVKRPLAPPAPPEPSKDINGLYVDDTYLVPSSTSLYYTGLDGVSIIGTDFVIRHLDTELTLCTDGRILHNGREIEQDKELVDALRELAGLGK